VKPTRGALRRVAGFLLAAGLVAAFFAILAVVGDVREAGALLRRLTWGPVVTLVALGVLDHGIRYVRWEVLLRRVSGRGFSRSTNVVIYLLGSLFIFTPARAGEVSKSVYARGLLGVPVEKGVSVLVAERVIDVVVMAVLALAGLVLLGRHGGFWQATLIAPALLVAVGVGLFVLNRAARRRGESGIAARLAKLAAPADESRKVLLSPGTLALNAGLGFAAWAVEVAMYFTALSALGQPATGHLAFIVLAVFPLASLAGALSLMPGGLGATEGGLATLGVVLGDLAAELSAVAGLLARAAILGVVVIGGLAAMVFVATIARPTWRAALAGEADAVREGGE